MKLHRDLAVGQNIINSYGPGHVMVNGERFESSLVVLPDSLVPDWCPGVDGLAAAHLEQLLTLKPEVVMLGTGSRQRFPAPAVLRPLIEARIGVEVMSTPAACRTYNILVSEGRRAAAALLFDPA